MRYHSHVKVILFGASGMVGQGVLRECLLDRDVETVLLIGRTASGLHDAKIREIVHQDIGDLTVIEGELSDYHACFFCLGVSSAGMTEEQYERVTYGFTMAAAALGIVAVAALSGYFTARRATTIAPVRALRWE